MSLHKRTREKCFGLKEFGQGMLSNFGHEQNEINEQTNKTSREWRKNEGKQHLNKQMKEQINTQMKKQTSKGE